MKGGNIPAFWGKEGLQVNCIFIQLASGGDIITTLHKTEFFILFYAS